MPISYKVITPPSAEPVTLTDAKDYLNVDFSSKDALITRLISDARRYAENMLRKSLAVQTIQLIQEFDHVAAGPLSGPVDASYDTWRLAERPDIPLFGNAQVTLQCLMGPVQSLISVEYQLTRMDQPEWTLLTTPDGSGNDTYRLDTYADPNEVNIFTILAATRFRLTYTAGSTTLPDMQFDLRNTLLSLINYWWEHREGDPVPEGIRQQFVERRVFML